jgi:hypothetical protein
MSKAKDTQGIETLRTFIEILNNLAKKEDIRYFFRGHMDTTSEKETGKLTPSVYRNGTIDYEHKFFNDTIVKYPQEFAAERTTIEKLVKMQHYGVPTRLLDITSNPLVALFFACQNENDKKPTSGELFIFSVREEDIKPYNSKTVAILANLAKMDQEKSEILKKGIEEYYNNATTDEGKAREAFNKNYAGYLLAEIKEDFNYFEPLINPKDFNRILVIKVKQNNPRIIRQDGAFLIFGIDKDKKICTPSNIIRPELSGNTRVIIHHYAKKEILEELEILGINESTLFPELDSYAKFLKSSYPSKNNRRLFKL